MKTDELKVELDNHIEALEQLRETGSFNGIQYKRDTGEWRDCSLASSLEIYLEHIQEGAPYPGLFRLKPQPRVVPWTADTAIMGASVRFKPNHSHGDFMESGVYAITAIYSGGVELSGRYIGYGSLSEIFEQTNKEPCGVEEVRE